MAHLAITTRMIMLSFIADLKFLGRRKKTAETPCFAVGHRARDEHRGRSVLN